MSKETTAPPRRANAPGNKNRTSVTRLKRLLGEESGQVLPWVVVCMMVVLGMAALSVDLGRAMVIRRQLQMQADAAALAAATSLKDADYSSVGQSYSGSGLNAASGISVGTPTLTPLCLTTVASWGIQCSSYSANANAVQVTETATVTTLFARLLGKPSLTVSATSTASPGRPTPYNIALIVDTTASMSNIDSNCGSGQTQLSCAFQGARQLLQGLSPTYDYVSLFTFPGITDTSASTDYGCSGSSATDGPYTFPSTTATSMQKMPYTTTTYVWGYVNGRLTQVPVSHTVYMTYQVLDYSNDYRSSESATTLNPSSNLVKALGGKSGCPSMQTSNDYNTYFAATIYAAQSSLLAEQAARTAAGTLGSQNVIILLSDGNATAMNNSYFQDFVTSSSQSTTWADSSGNYPNSNGGGSWIGECGQAVDAAQYAATYTNNNTTVYTIAYGSPSTSKSGGRYGNGGNCSTDIGGGSHSGITPCETMQQMSSGWPNKKTNFYSDFYDAAQGDSGCQAADKNNTITSLNNIFGSILDDLVGARLIPNGTP